MKISNSLELLQNQQKMVKPRRDNVIQSKRLVKFLLSRSRPGGTEPLRSFFFKTTTTRSTSGVPDVFLPSCWDSLTPTKMEARVKVDASYSLAHLASQSLLVLKLKIMTNLSLLLSRRKIKWSRFYPSWTPQMITPLTSLAKATLRGLEASFRKRKPLRNVLVLPIKASKNFWSPCSNSTQTRDLMPRSCSKTLFSTQWETRHKK